MKRIFTLLALIGLFISASAQTRTLVTLSHNGELTFFDKNTAFEDALEAAVDGDKIYLSSGTFGKSENLNITKKISIIGNGYDSKILFFVQFELENNAYEYSSPLLEGVRLERLNLESGVGVYPIEIKTCKINNLVIYNMENVLLDRCFIDQYSLSGNSQNVTIRNSKIKIFNGNSCEVLENCNIKNFNAYHFPAYAASCIIDGVDPSYGGVYENCLMLCNIYAMGSYEPQTHNCYKYIDNGLYVSSFLDNDLETTDDYRRENTEREFKGVDGTEVGIYGGQWYPFTTTPTLPTVDASKSSVTYDADNHQLKVTITIAE